jgi:hypothetical protein
MLFEAVYAADHRRLAGARRTADDDALAAHDLQVDIAQYMEVAEPFVHVDHLDRGVAEIGLAVDMVKLERGDGILGHEQAPSACGRCSAGAP